MTELLSTILGSILSFLLVYKYAALFFVCFIAAFAIPFPASTTLVAAGSFASQGFMNLYLVLLVAFFANVLGDWTGYMLSRKYGRRLLERSSYGHVVESSLFRAIEKHMQHTPHSLIFMTRFITSAGPMVNYISGLMHVPARTYAFFEITGEATYVLLYGMSGYFLGLQWEENLGFIAKGALLMVSLSMATALMQVMLHRRVSN
jgi:membrane-associated protein